MNIQNEMSDLNEYAEVLDAEATNVTTMREAETTEETEIIAELESAPISKEIVVSGLLGFDDKKASQAAATSSHEPGADTPTTCCRQCRHLDETCCTSD